MRASFPSALIDRMMFVGQELGLGEMLCQLEMTFDHALDEDRLRRAMSLLPRLHPILGCRLVTRNLGLVWEHADLPQRLEVVGDDDGLEQFRTRPADASAGALSACLKTGGGKSQLVLRFSHVVTDGGGLQEGAADLASIYRALRDDPSYVPPIRARASRSSFLMLSQLPLRAYPVVVRRMLRFALAELPPRHTGSRSCR